MTSARNFKNLARSWRGPGTTLANLLYTLCEKSRLEPPNFCWKYLRGSSKITPVTPVPAPWALVLVIRAEGSGV